MEDTNIPCQVSRKNSSGECEGKERRRTEMEVIK
jgi:hypothetical protein